MFDKSDDAAVTAIDDYLYDQGFEVLTPMFEGDESEIREAHQDNLKFSHASPTRLQKLLLGNLKYVDDEDPTFSKFVVHSDTTILPDRRSKHAGDASET